MKIMKILMLLACMFFLSSCSKPNIEFESMAEHTSLEEETQYGNMALTFSNLNGEAIRSFKSRTGKAYTFSYNYLITEGALKLQFRDSQDNVLSELAFSEETYQTAIDSLQEENEGEVNIIEIGSNVTIESADEKIKIVLIGNNAKGKIQITW
ncbi:hypothetical protein KHM83_19065 [Fusibacter paucivorans]|uniref:Uncharacterized protein n=1 Tax=Fusibacter paucivorans TaxID=76009 RepID=A0ABS5PW01_9FIRM|nr:hypothetical protein [Fusibacter paucivorans]MBS7528771.1 hypothetical protein [Fusibacter paucivorans]